MILVDLPFKRRPSAKANLLAFAILSGLVMNRPLAAERLTGIVFLLMKMSLTQWRRTLTLLPTSCHRPSATHSEDVSPVVFYDSVNETNEDQRVLDAKGRSLERLGFVLASRRAVPAALYSLSLPKPPLRKLQAVFAIR